MSSLKFSDEQIMRGMAWLGYRDRVKSEGQGAADAFVRSCCANSGEDAEKLLRELAEFGASQDAENLLQSLKEFGMDHDDL